MRCRSCTSTNTRVTSTDKLTPEVVKRYCRCLDCGTKFRTIERYEVAKPVPIHLYKAEGTANGQSRLNENEVLMIRHLHQTGLSNGQLAIRFGHNSSTISRIVNYKTYLNLK